MLSIISFYLIEKPVRKIEFKQVKKFLFSLTFLIIVFLGFSYLSIKNNGFEDRIHVFLKNSARAKFMGSHKDDKEFVLIEMKIFVICQVKIKEFY